MQSFIYRPDIDGLRTFAVIPVILFHIRASWMPGGFVGVDIFFVISGYLISSIILHEITSGDFSFLHFYERRLRRIIPALLIMLLVTIAVFQVIALPDQAEGAAESGIAALLSVSNFYFWTQTGYFVPKTEFMPLVHTWSLAVEEQFYFLFPMIMLVVAKLRLPIRCVIALGTVVAFMVGFWLSIDKPSVAYYLLPARAWELAIGATIAAGVVPQIPLTALREAVPALGLGMILVAIFCIRSDMIFPGWVALIPCLGTAMIIHAGGTSWVARKILAFRPIVLVGLLSYSLYLWHWPVLAALRIQTASVHLDLHVAAGAILLTFLLAWLSWRFVEKPFRDRRGMTASRMLALLGGGSVAVFGLVGASMVTAGFPERLPQPARIALAAADDFDQLRASCQGSHDLAHCRFGNPNGPVSYAIIGDSHAAAIRPAVEASGLMGDAAGTLYWTGGCPLLDGAELGNHLDRASCRAFRSAVWAKIETSPTLKTVVLAGRWPAPMTGWLPESGGSNRTWLVDAETIAPSPAENVAVLRRSFRRTIDRLASMGLRVVIIGSVPEPGFDVPHAVAMARYVGREVPRGIPRGKVEARAGAADALLAAAVKGRPGVELISIWRTFCGEEWCDIQRGGVPIYSDHGHLSYRGAISVAAPAIAKPRWRPD